MTKLVVLGTASGVGKSTITTVLCNLFSKEGLNVYPFKAQNMSLNSTSTWFGEEIAYIQYIQCLAARVKTVTAHVNPVLLKPVSERVSEVIVLGRPRYLLDGSTYMSMMRARLWDVADTSLRLLSKVSDIVIVEGAGAGFEPNLYEQDLANRLPMTHRDSKCVIVADIYRGGAFTSALGTFLSLPETVRERVVGFIINRLCGDERILREAIRWLEAKTKKKVLGVVHLREEFNILPEDSLDIPLLAEKEPSSLIDVALISYPGVANFGEFHLLKLNPDVCLRLVRRASEIGEPDLIVLPGSRNVFRSLSYLKRMHIHEKLLKLAGSVPIVGICGGFQILSHLIEDPYGKEAGEPVRARGLGMIPARVVYRESKIVCRVKCKLLNRRDLLVGFEIHRGVPSFSRESPLFEVLEKNHEQCSALEGYQDDKNMLYATMIHEVISRPRFLNYILRGVGKRVSEIEPEDLLMSRIERASQLLKRYVDFDLLVRIASE